MMHGFLVWGLFVVLLVLMIALGAGSALGSATGILSTSVDKLTPDQIQTAGWGTVFALAIALASTILGALCRLVPKSETRSPVAEGKQVVPEARKSGASARAPLFFRWSKVGA